jgi:hypothetical protein
MTGASNNVKNTENSFELLKAAQKDIATINLWVESDKYSMIESSGILCRFSAEACEKMIKAWILEGNPNMNLVGVHDLMALASISIGMNNSFQGIKNQLNFLNNFTTKLRYSSPFKIADHEVKQCFKVLKEIYDFPLIKELREKIDKNNKFNILPDDISVLFRKTSNNLPLT